ncbi:MAG: EAL domain-containing protein [Nitrosomonadales bacterium]|nr:EAL domain-containing protein [Nitrosomonadales bacterium]
MFDELDREVFAAGDQIFKEGDAGDCAYLIEKGTVEVFVIDQGKERQLNLLGKGEMFGEIALIDHQPRTATVRAAEETVLVPIRRKLVEELMEKSDPVLNHLLLVILDRFRNKQSSNRSHMASTEDLRDHSSRRSALKGEATHKLSLAHGITHALVNSEFELYYQPICNLSDGRIAGFEALIRWHHPTDGVIQPMDFLWLAEQTGLIREIGLWTLERACRDWPKLRQYTNYEKPFVSVNLSAVQLASEMLVEDVKGIIARHSMEVTELKLELTETVIIEHPELALKILNKLIELGSGLALDDYGTGHSGLNHLQRYPIGTLKIDRAFVAPLLESAQSYEIVRSSVDLAHSLGMNVVAEGVEAKEVGAKLLEMGCDFGQGWHYGRPAALQDLVMRHAITQQQQL